MTLFIDILGIGVVIPVLPKLVKELLAPTTSMPVGETGEPSLSAIAEGASAESGDVDTSNIESSDADIYSQAGRYVGVIGASYALMQFLFAPVLGALSDRFGRRPIILISLFGLGIDFLDSRLCAEHLVAVCGSIACRGDGRQFHDSQCLHCGHFDR